MEEKSKTIDSGDTRTCMAFTPSSDANVDSPCQKILEVAQGMEYIHSEGVVHGDIRGVFFLKYLC